MNGLQDEGLEKGWRNSTVHSSGKEPKGVERLASLAAHSTYLAWPLANEGHAIRSRLD